MEILELCLTSAHKLQSMNSRNNVFQFEEFMGAFLNANWLPYHVKLLT